MPWRPVVESERGPLWWRSLMDSGGGEQKDGEAGECWINK